MDLIEKHGKNMRNGRVNMSQAKLDRIQEINVKIMQLDNKRINGGISLSDINGIAEEIKKLEDERDVLEKAQLAEEQAAEQAEHEQKAQEVNGSNSDIAIAILEAAIPDESAIQTKIGFTEYGILRTDLLQMIDGALTDRTATLQQKYAEEMAIRDEKVRLVQKQTNEVRQQLDEANQNIVVLNSTLDEYKNVVENECNNGREVLEMLNETKTKLNESQYEIEKCKAVELSLKSQIADLEQQLAAAKKPKTEAQPSQSFTDRMNEIKTKNEARIKSNLELAAEGALGYRGKVELPSVPQQEQPFPETVTPDTGSNQVLDAESTVEAPTFQTIQAPPLGLPMAVITSNDSGEGEETPVTREWVESTIDARIAKAIAEIRGAA